MRQLDLHGLEEAIGYTFSDVRLLDEATTHPSADIGYSNERLEFLGDAVLGLIVGRMVYDKFPDDPEGTLSRRRSAVVRTDSLAAVGRKLGISKYLNIGNGQEQIGRDNRHMLEDAVEAVLGAVYLDGGFEEAQRLVTAFLGPALTAQADSTDTEDLNDYKSRLQEMVQARVRNNRITYTLVKREGAPHCPTFTIALRIGDVPVCEGVGSSKKSAEQKAAHEAVEQFDTLIGPLLDNDSEQP